MPWPSRSIWKRGADTNEPGRFGAEAASFARDYWINRGGLSCKSELRTLLLDPCLAKELSELQQDLRATIGIGVKLGIPITALNAKV